MSTVSELRILAKTLNVRGYSTAKKGELIALIEKHQAGQKPVALDSAPAPTEPAKEVKVEEVKVKAKRNNDWNAYLAEYRKTNGGTLRQAMSVAKEEYAKHKEAKKASKPTSPDLP